MWVKKWLQRLPVVKQYQFKWVLLIAFYWTLIDLIRFSVFVWIEKDVDYPFIYVSHLLAFVYFLSVFLCSVWMAYLIVITLKKSFRHLPFRIGIIIKTIILYGIALLFYSVLFFSIYYFTYDLSFAQIAKAYTGYFFYDYYLLNNSAVWIMLFIVTQLIVEINEKYSPGIFRAILAGKYIVPQEEKKIIMFIDLKDSTAIAEQLGHKTYFLFIRDFIYHTSLAILKWEADIYQYVGDEVVLSWPATEKNYTRCIQALLEVRKELQKENDYYRSKYGMIPDFRAGIHTGNVMIGEIGVIKKDLAMSGDSMNISARIKNMVTDLNKKFIATRDFVEAAGLKDFQVESAGIIELKGKETGVELFILQL